MMPSRTKGHIPRKRFGQHFLVDQGVIAAIVEAIAPQSEDRMIEIGPGLGAMTQPLLKALKQLVVIEFDRDLALRWRQNAQAAGQLTVVEADVLKVNFLQLAAPSEQKLRVVGNLPYNISSPLLFHLMAAAHLIQDQHFLLQKEVVDRMVAAPATSQYGRLSVMLQWRYEMTRLFDVAPHAFDPPPRVHSALVRMLPLAKPKLLGPERLSAIVKVAFSQRRKLLRHTLGEWLQQKGFSGDFDVQRRAEEVSVQEYVELAQQFN